MRSVEIFYEELYPFLKKFFLTCVYFVCRCVVCVYTGTCDTAGVVVRGQLVRVVLCFLHVGPRDQTPILRLDTLIL